MFRRLSGTGHPGFRLNGISPDKQSRGTTTMTTTIAFDPTFPGGTQVDVAVLETIDFRLLVRKDHSESVKLLRSCEEQGFFYLDLVDTDAASVFEVEDRLLQVTKQYFDQSLEMKLKDDQNSLVYG